MSLLFSIQLVWAAPIQSSTAYYDTYVKVGNLGNYEFIMETHEIPSHEVLSIVGKEYFPKTAATYISEVDNTTPDAIYKAKTISKVDVVFAFGDSSKASAIQDLIPSFTTALQSASNSVDAYVEQVETNTIDISAMSPEAILSTWNNYPGGGGHYAAGWHVSDGKLTTQMNVNWTGFLDWSEQALKTTDGTYEFTITGAQHGDPQGWTFRTQNNGYSYSFYGLEIDQAGGYANLFCITSWHPSLSYPTHGGPYYHGCISGCDGTYDYSQKVSAQEGAEGKHLGVVAIEKYREYKVKIVNEGANIDVYIDDGLSTKEIHAVDGTLKVGTYGPYTASQFTAFFSDIKVTSGGTKTLGAAISDVHWRDNSTRFVIYCDDTIPEYMETTDNTDYQYTVTKLLNSNIYLINICTATNLDTLDELIKFISIDGENKGISIYNQTPSKSLTTAKDWILSKVENLSKPEDWILVNDEVIWETEYFDQEKDLPLNFGEHDGTKNSDVSDQQLAEAWGVGLTHLYTSDKIQAEKWRYRHFNNYFDNSTIRESFHNIWIADPVEIFPNPGLYRINYKRKDNPLHPDISQDNVFDNYRYWSKHYDKLPNFEGA